MEIDEIRATIYFLKAEEGGRKAAPAFPSYRPLLDFGVRGMAGGSSLNEGIVVLENNDHVELGHEYLVRIRPLHPELLRDRLRPGLRFQLTEGPARVVGHGTITELLSLVRDGERHAASVS